MKRILMVLSLCVTVMGMGMGVAQSATSGAQQECEAQAAVKKLAGAAKTSFVGKCVKDASASAKASQCEKRPPTRSWLVRPRTASCKVPEDGRGRRQGDPVRRRRRTRSSPGRPRTALSRSA